MSQILRNVRIGSDSVKVETMRSASSPDEEKRYSLLDLRKVVAEAELRVRMEAEREKNERSREQEARLADAMGTLAAGERLLREERERLLVESAPHLMTLALEIARRIVRTQLEIPGAVQSLIEEMLQQVGQARDVVLRVAPSDLAFLREHGALSRLEGERIRLAADESMTPGGCFVETERGSWDCRIETQLERIEEALRSTAADWADQEAA